jgi:hypothetical protein
MNRTRALIVSLAVGLAAIMGVFALGHTLALSHATSSTTDQQVAKRTRQLNRYEASLRRTLAQKPPALPAVPRTGSTGSTLQVAAGAPAPSVESVRVIYHRPPPVVVIKHRAGGEAEAEHEGVEADD